MYGKLESLPEIRRRKLKKLLDEGKHIRLLEAHNGISALIVNETSVQSNNEKREFDGVWVSSLTETGARGFPDAEILGFHSRLDIVQQVIAVTHKPVLVDCDTGGDAAQLEYMVSTLELCGASGIVIEDKAYPKRNSLSTEADQTLEDPYRFAQKIRRGILARRTEDFLLIARIEALIAGQSVDEAISRAERYLKAGASGILIHSRKKKETEILEFAARYDELCKKLGFRKPLVCVPTTYNSVTDQFLFDHNFDVIIHANHLFRAAVRAMRAAATCILENDRSFDADEHCVSLKDVFNTVGFDALTERDLQYR